MLNLTQKNKILNLLLPIILFVFVIEVVFYHSAVTDWLCDAVEYIGAFGWATILILQFLQVIFVPIPAYFITLTSMKMYPNQLILLFALTLIVVVLAVLVAYLIGRKWGSKAVIWASGSREEYEKWEKVLKSKKMNIFYLITILLPIFPDDILCILAGSIKMNFWWFLFCNIMGRGIGLATFMFVFQTVSNSLVSIVVFGVLSIILIVLKIIVKRKLKNESISNRE